jgi:Flp pilus assembly pilin Flp
MTTIIERDIYHSDSGAETSAVTLLVAIVAVVLIGGLTLYALRVFPNAGSNTGGSMKIDVSTPAVTDPPPTTPAQ